MACSALFSFIRDINKLMDSGLFGREDANTALDTLRKFDTVLGVVDVDSEDEIPDEINAMVEARQQARKNKNFAESDRLRDELAAAGWIVEDTPAGSRVKRA